MPASPPVRLDMALARRCVLVVLVALAAAGPAAAVPSLQQYTSGGHVLGFGPQGFYLSDGGYSLRVELVQGRGAAPVAEGATDGATEGAAAADATPRAAAGAAPPLGRVHYREVWPGIGVDYDAPAAGIVRSTWHLAPGADPGAIRLRYNRPVHKGADGSLSIETSARGELRESAPIAWQEVDGRRQPVTVAFSLAAPRAEAPRTEAGGARGGAEVGFTLGAYDPTLPLEIDPTLAWNTFLGGSNLDFAKGIALDGSGGVLVSGTSSGTWGAPLRAYAGSSDAFVAKLDASGNLVWNTFLGSSASDSAFGIAVDASGNALVAGSSADSWGTPVEPYAGVSDAFAAKLDAASGALIWNTFVGGPATSEVGDGVAVDAAGNAYVTGYSNGGWGTPVRPFAGGGSDAFVARLDGSGMLVWNTFLGGPDGDFAEDVAVDASGNVYASGESSATWGVPVRPYAGADDGFAAKLDPGGALVWNTFLGGADGDGVYGITVDASGDVYAGGFSEGAWGAPPRPYSASGDGFAARLDANGVLLWNTFLGGTGYEDVNDLAVDGAGSVFVAGDGDASWGTPLRPYAGGGDAMVARVDPSPSVVEVPTLSPAMLGLLALALLGVALGVLRRGS